MAERTTLLDATAEVPRLDRLTWPDLHYHTVTGAARALAIAAALGLHRSSCIGACRSTTTSPSSTRAI